LQHKLQAEILAHAAELVKPGGVLVYSTCSIFPSENSEIVAVFLKSFPEFHIEDARGFLPDAVVNEHGDMETFTHRHDTDGAYAARLRRSPATS
jgi:16S rRNA (cytosine967-C5)-methyltransferase